MNKSSVITGISGTIIQWYDFSLFGFLAPIISHQYFPHENHFLALLSTFAVFAVGFVLAPLGAIFFGHIGDRRGRKHALTLSILLMTIPTSLIAILPNYTTIGIIAPILLTLFRLTQGFVASAEFAGSALFLTEHARENKRTFYASLTSSSYSIGMVLGAIVASFVTLSFMPHWAWRIAFALSAIGGLLVFYLRKKVSETPDFESQVVKTKSTLKYPFIKALRDNPCSIATTFAMAIYVGIVSFASYVFMVTYLHLYAKLHLSTAIFLISLALLLDAFVEPFFALLADKLGRKVLMLIGSFTLAILIYPIYQGIASQHFDVIVICVLGLSFVIALTFSPSNALLTLSFAPRYRFSGYSVSWNIGMAIFGGTTPLILTWLVAHQHPIFGPAIYYWFAIAVGIISLIFTKSYSQAQQP